MFSNILKKIIARSLTPPPLRPSFMMVKVSIAAPVVFLLLVSKSTSFECSSEASACFDDDVCSECATAGVQDQEVFTECLEKHYEQDDPCVTSSSYACCSDLVSSNDLICSYFRAYTGCTTLTCDDAEEVVGDDSGTEGYPFLLGSLGFRVFLKHRDFGHPL